MSRSLVDFEMFPNNVVTNEGDLVHFTLLAETKPINHEEELKHDLWMVAMLEEMKVIENSETWVLIELPLNKTPILMLNVCSS